MSERSGAEPTEEQQPRSGLRNPSAAVRGQGAGALASEGVVLLLAIRPVQVLGDGLTGGGVWVIVALAVVCFALAGMLRRAWAWHAASVLQVVLFACGFVVHASLAVLAVVFGLLWAYVLHVRRKVLG